MGPGEVKLSGRAGATPLKRLTSSGNYRVAAPHGRGVDCEFALNSARRFGRGGTNLDFPATHQSQARAEENAAGRFATAIARAFVDKLAPL